MYARKNNWMLVVMALVLSFSLQSEFALAEGISIQQEGNGNSVLFLDELTQNIGSGEIQLTQAGEDNIIELSHGMNLIAFIEQVGVGGYISLDLEGAGSQLRAFQDGVLNNMTVSFNGTGFDGVISQNGSGNDVSLSDFGSDNQYNILQLGRDNSISIDSVGDNNTTELLQDGVGNVIEIDSMSSGFRISIDQSGSNSSIRIQ